MADPAAAHMRKGEALCVLGVVAPERHVHRNEFARSWQHWKRRMNSILRSFDVHGMRLNVLFESPRQIQPFDALLRAFSITPSEQSEHEVHVSFGLGPREDSQPAGLGLFWGGLMPDGAAVNVWTAPGLRQIDLPGIASMRIDLPAGRTTLVVQEDRHERLGWTCITPLICELMRRRGHHVVHSACLVMGEGVDARAVLLAGPSGGGKTTASLAMAAGRWRLGGDDATFVTRPTAAGGLGVWAIPRPCKVHRKTLALVPWLGGLPSCPTANADEVFVDCPAAAGPQQMSAPAAVFFISHHDGPGHFIQEMDKLQAVGQLARQNVRAFESDGQGPTGESFRMLAQLADACGTFSLGVGINLADLGDRIAEHIER